MIATHPLEAFEEAGELWSPRRDPLGTAWGVDLEPLQGGMAELDRKEHAVREEPTATAAGLLACAWRWAAGLPPRAEARVAPGDDDIGRRIEAEIDDYEIEAACTAPRRAA